MCASQKLYLYSQPIHFIHLFFYLLFHYYFHFLLQPYSFILLPFLFFPPSILLIHHSLYYLLSLCRLPCILPGLCRSRILRLCTVRKARGSAAASECTCILWHVFIFLSVTALPRLRSHLQRQVHQAKALISYDSHKDAGITHFEKNR